MQDTAPNRGRVLVSPLLPGREVENVLMQLFSPQYSLSPSALNATEEGDTSKAWGFKFKSKFFYSHNTHKKSPCMEKSEHKEYHCHGNRNNFAYGAYCTVATAPSGCNSSSNSGHSQGLHPRAALDGPCYRWQSRSWWGHVSPSWGTMRSHVWVHRV